MPQIPEDQTLVLPRTTSHGVVGQGTVMPKCNLTFRKTTQHRMQMVLLTHVLNINSPSDQLMASSLPEALEPRSGRCCNSP